MAAFASSGFLPLTSSSRPFSAARTLSSSSLAHNSRNSSLSACMPSINAALIDTPSLIVPKMPLEPDAVTASAVRCAASLNVAHSCAEKSVFVAMPKSPSLNHLTATLPVTLRVKPRIYPATRTQMPTPCRDGEFREHSGQHQHAKTPKAIHHDDCRKCKCREIDPSRPAAPLSRPQRHRGYDDDREQRYSRESI